MTSRVDPPAIDARLLKLPLLRRGNEDAVALFVLSVWTSVAAVSFGTILMLIYAFNTVVRYDYMGYVWGPDWIALGIGTVIVALVALFLPLRLERSGDIFIYVLFCIVFVPSMMVPSGAGQLNLSQLLEMQLALATCFFIVLVVNRSPIVTTPRSIFTPRGFAVLLMGLAVISMGALIRFFGVPSSLPGFASVYERRLTNSADLAAMPTVVGYVWFWVAKVVSPFLFSYGLVKRSAALIGTGILSALYLYGTNGLKNVVFSMLLIFVIWFIVRIAKSKTLLLILPALVAFMPVAYLVDVFVTDYWLTDLLARRTFIVPGMLTGYYHGFFTENDYANWSYSFLSMFYPNQYDVTPPFLVGATYISPETSANAHVWADGFANFGYPGMAFVTILVGVVIWTINSVTVRHAFELTAPLAAIMAYSLSNAAITVSILTHGIAFLILLLLLAPGHESSQDHPYKGGSGVISLLEDERSPRDKCNRPKISKRKSQLSKRIEGSKSAT